MPDNTNASENPLSTMFPESGRVLLTGGGKQFVERLGVTAIRETICRVMSGENLRTETEPLSRRRIAQVSGALVALFTKGYLSSEDFGERLSGYAIERLQTSSKSDKASVWPAQWILGLTNKSVQNVLRGDAETLKEYVADFEEAVRDAAKHCREQLGDYRMRLGVYESADGKSVELGWEAITRLTTAIGAQTLAIRGSDKSMYGKLFERLILGSVLSLLDFERVDRNKNTKDRGVFWLSDSTDDRESDATLLVEPGKVARFDIGFIGVGNSEISKDKLTRYRTEMEYAGETNTSVTFIVVDRLPRSGTTEEVANQIGAEIVQMSMAYWPRTLARLLQKRLGVSHQLADLADGEIAGFLKSGLDKIAPQDFLGGVSVLELEKPAADDGDE
jgi:hypothetical protein